MKHFPSRRALFSAGLASFALSCQRRGATGFPGYALVAAAGENALSVVDLLQFRHIRSIALNAMPTAVLEGPGKQVFVLTPETGSLHQFDGDLRPRGTLRWADTLAAAALSADGRSLLAISSPTRELLVGSLSYSTAAPRSGSVRRYKLDDIPVHLMAGPAGYAALSSGNAGTIELLHIASGQRWKRRLNASIGQLQFRADGQLLLVANLQNRSLLALSVPKLEVLAELPLAMRPDNLCFGADGGQLFITGDGMDGVAIVFPYRVLQVDQTVLAGRDPGVMATSDSPPYLFVGSASGSDICILDIDKRRVIGLVDVAERPGFITVTPDYQYALVLNESSGDMAVIHIGSIRQNFSASRYKAGASLFTLLPVGKRPVHALVVQT